MRKLPPDLQTTYDENANIFSVCDSNGFILECFDTIPDNDF